MAAEPGPAAAFLGANPAEVPSGPHQGMRVLAAEERTATATADRAVAVTPDPRVQ